MALPKGDHPRPVVLLFHSNLVAYRKLSPVPERPTPDAPPVAVHQNGGPHSVDLHDGPLEGFLQ